MSQFSPVEEKKTLADFFTVPKDVYPVGRLDYDSEGLLILTNNKQINHRLLNPAFRHQREYWVQVDGAITEEAINQLSRGVTINVDGKIHKTQPAVASLFQHEPNVPLRTPPIRFRKSIPAPWIKIILSEGKNRQVRKMTAAVGYPTLRLIRTRIQNLSLEGMLPGEIRSLSYEQLYTALFNFKNKC